MNLSQIDITYISIAIGYTIIIFTYNKYIKYDLRLSSKKITKVCNTVSNSVLYCIHYVIVVGLFTLFFLLSGSK